MIKIYFEINGKRVEPKDLADDIEKRIYIDIAEKIKEDLSSTFCKEHEEYPTVILKGIEKNEITFSIDACCQDLTDTAKENVQE